MLRSATQGHLLARIVIDAAKEYNLTQLVEWTESSMPTVLREVERAELAGIVLTRKVGPTRLVRANEHHPLYPALRTIILATYGPPAIIADTFANLANADAVLLYGSWAARYLGEPGRAPNDIDVLVLGNVNLDALADAAETAEHLIGLPVQATARPTKAWLNADHSFTQQLRARPLVTILINDTATDLATDLAQLTNH
jgi:hypothetical protein